MKNMPTICRNDKHSPAAIADRINRHNAPHTITTLDPIRLQAVCPSAQADILATADCMVSSTLRLLAKGGNPIPDRIESNRRRDALMNQYSDMANAAAEYRTAHESAQAEAERYAAIADRISTDTERRAHAIHERDTARRAAAQALEHAQAIERRMASMTHSDRSDLVQIAAAAIMTHGTANAAPITAAIREAVRKAGSVNGYISTRSDILRPATAADIDMHTTYTYTDRKTGETRRIYEPLPHMGRHGTQDGVECIEHRAARTRPDGTTQAAGLYIIHRRQTSPAYTSFQTWTENGGTLTDTNNGINAITNQTDKADIERLIDRAGLTPTERKALLHAVRLMQTPAAMYAADRAGLTETEAVTRIWCEAFRAAGVYDAVDQIAPAAADLRRRIATAAPGAYTGAMRTRLSRLRAKLTAAKAAMQEQEQDTTPAPADLLKWTDTHTAPTAHVVQWVQTAAPAEPAQDTAPRLTAADIVTAHTITPTRATEADYGRMFDRIEEYHQTAQEAARAAHRASVTATKAAQAKAAYKAAQAAAQALVKDDASPAAQATRRATAITRKAAAEAAIRAEDCKTDLAHLNRIMASIITPRANI